MRNSLLTSTIALSALLAGCTTAAPTRVSTIPAPQPATAASVIDEPFEARWWQQFGDPTLDGLMTLAFGANRDLQSATARVVAAREIAGAARTAHMPTGGLAASVARQHASELESGGTGPTRTVTAYRTGLEVAWEADLFGRVRGRARAAWADAAAVAFDARAVRVALAAQVAAAYFDWLGARRDLSLIADQRRLVGDLIAKTRTLVDAGRLTRLDLLRTRQIEEELAAEQATVTHAAERARLRLATLTGQAPDSWTLTAPSAPALRARRLPIGAVTEVLARRPDVGAAQARLEAALTRAGVARAEVLPRIELSGSLGLVAGSVGRLAEAGATSWLIAPRLAWSVFDWPQLRRRARAAGALADAAFADYEQAALLALEEVRVAIDAYGAATERLLATERRLDAASGAAAILSVQYREGLVDSLARTLAERDRIAGEIAASRALSLHQQAIVDLYRALGGGWE